MCDPKLKCDPETKQTANQIKHVVGTQMSSEPAGYFPWPNQSSPVRQHGWFYYLQPPWPVGRRAQTGKVTRVDGQFKLISKKSENLVQTFPSTLGQSVKDISVFNSGCGAVAVTIVTGCRWLVVVQIFRSEAKPVRMVWKFLFCNILMFR